MKKSANINNKEKIVKAFEILKVDYPKAELVYSSTDKLYWHFAQLNARILYSTTIRLLTKANIGFTVVVYNNHIELEV